MYANNISNGGVTPFALAMNTPPSVNPVPTLVVGVKKNNVFDRFPNSETAARRAPTYHYTTTAVEQQSVLLS